MDAATLNKQVNETVDLTMEAEVFISGGGPVGLLLALGLAKQNRSVVLAECLDFQFEASQNKSSFDGRVLALTLGSKQFLKSLGIWEALAPKTTPIKHVHVSQKGYLGLTKLHADEMGVAELGVSVMASDLGSVLWQAVQKIPLIRVLHPAELTDFTQDKTGVIVSAQKNDEQISVHAKLLIGADGTYSKVRTILDLPLQQKDYHAFGVIAKIETELPHQNWAFERFTEEGPVALLPLNSHEHKAVFVCPGSQIEEVKSWDDETFIRHFTEKMGERFGRFVAVSERVAYPLKETYAPKMRQGRAILMGNASHTQHPVAAQGLNLGIRDIQSFLSVLQPFSALVDWSSLDDVLDDYVLERGKDHEKIMGLTDGLIQLFQTPSPLMGHLRGLGLMVMERMPKLKKRFTKMTMGVDS